jgi:LysM repeat protein
MEEVKEIKINLQIETNKRSVEKEFSNVFDLKTFMESFFSSSDLADRRAGRATDGYAGPERRRQGSKIETENTNEEKVDNIGQVHEKNSTVKQETANNSRSKAQVLIYGSIAVFILIIFSTLIFKANDKAMSEDINHAKHVAITFEEKFPRLASELIELKQYLSKLDESQKFLIPQLDELSQKIDRMEKKIALVAIDTKASVPIHTKALSQTESLYHEVRPGETLFRIAKKHSMSVDKLCRLNRITPKTLLHPGQKLLVSK